MSKILFASNNVSHFPTLVSSSLAGSFDPNRVPYSFALGVAETVNSPVFVPAVGEDTWFHFSCYPRGVGFGDTDHWFSAFDALDRKIFQLLKTDNVAEALASGTTYNGTTSVNADGVIAMTLNKMNFVDIHVKVNLVTIVVKLYVNRALSLTMTLGSNPNSYGKPVRFRLGAAFTASLGICHVSEVFVADGDTRNGRLNLLRPASAGVHSDWGGSLSTLVDDDSVTGMTSLLAGDKLTTIPTLYIGAANISNIALVTVTTKGLNAPTKLKHLIRLSTIDYESAEISLADSLQYNLSSYEINPGTSLPWVSSDLSAIETGFLSVA